MRLLILPLFAFFLGSCSILVGHVKPVEEKAVNGSAGAAILEPLGWKKVDLRAGSDADSDSPDAAWQSGKTSAVISLSSACRSSSNKLRGVGEVTDFLLSQWDSLTILSRKDLLFRGFPAQETTAIGTYLGNERKIRTFVLRTPGCTYDLVFLGPVPSFDQELSAFLGFRDSVEFQ